MRVLLLSPRFVWPEHTGDRLRAAIWLTALGERCDVTLVSPPGRIPQHAPRFHFEPARVSVANGAAGLLRVAAGAPVQSLLAAAYDWRGAIRRALSRAGTFDVSIVLLSRLDPIVRNLLPDSHRVLDAIDSLGRSMRERASQSSPWLRGFWREEARRMTVIESAAAAAYDRVLSVTEEDRRILGGDAVSNGVRVAPLSGAPRQFDCGFWGRLAYFANFDAATWLLDEIWPAVRARRPNATLLIAGADVPARLRAAHGRDGITVQSPVRDIAEMARRIRVAIFPLRYGTGQSNKVLEAAEAGCAIVGTAKAMRGLESLAGEAIVSDDADALASSAVELLRDEARLLRMAATLRRLVEREYSRTATLARLVDVVRLSEAA